MDKKPKIRHYLFTNMKNYTEKDFEKILQEILEEVKSYYPGFGKKEKEIIQKAFEYGRDSHKDQKRASGEPYFIHPLKATQILLSLKPDIETIVACLLHDVIEDTQESAQDIEKMFGKEIRFLCEGVEKITKVRVQKNENNYRYENIQKLFVAVAEDIRIIFIKLADRIHNLQTLHFIPAEKHGRIIRESLEVYAPVADRLGLFEFKTLIEDYCLKNKNPEIYDQIVREINIFKKQRHAFFESAQKEINRVFKQEKFPLQDLDGRQKSITSVYQKMKRKNYSSALDVYDIFGFRILVKSKEDCYKALGVLHSHFNPMPNRFKDYIAVPKPNGYQSLHTTLLGVAGSHIPIEIQIRTVAMHMDAEYGPAAHWAYKKLKNSNFDKEYIEKMAWFPNEIPLDRKQSPENFFQELSKNILEDQIYVFTRTGEIKILPRNATPVDFAYLIHTEIGDSCVGAHINGNIKPLDYKLKQGDIIEILTKKGRKPNPSWIDFIATSTAKNRIKTHINTLKKNQEDDDEKEEKKVIPPPEVKKYMSTTTRKKIPKQYSVIIGGEESISYRVGKCCNPVAGKNIIAYHTLGSGTVIHDAHCPELQNLDPERFEEAHFVLRKKLKITAKDRFGLMRDFSGIIADRHAFIWDARLVRKPNNMVINTFSIHVVNELDFQELLEDLKKVQNVLTVQEEKVEKKT